VWAGAERLLGGERVPEAASVIPVALVERGSA
jgi:hypothetical protein